MLDMHSTPCKSGPDLYSPNPIRTCVHARKMQWVASCSDLWGQVSGLLLLLL